MNPFSPFSPFSPSPSLLLLILCSLLLIFPHPSEGGSLRLILLGEHPSLGWNVSFPAEPSTFEPFLNSHITGRIFLSQPPTGCTPINPPSLQDPSPSAPPMPWIALIQRGGCTFASKILHAQQAGASFAIISNTVHTPGNLLVAMAPDSSSPSSLASQLTIPSAFVALETGRELGEGMEVRVERVEGEEGEGGSDRGSWVMILVIGTAVLLGSAALVFMVLAAQYFRFRRESGHPMPKPAPLKVIITLPLTQLQEKYLSSEPESQPGKEIADQTCSVCLDDYEVGSWVRHLPCGHCFHRDCIDAWLRKYNRTCPVCKHDIEQGVEHKALGPNEMLAQEGSSIEANLENTLSAPSATGPSSESAFLRLPSLILSPKESQEEPSSRRTIPEHNHTITIEAEPSSPSSPARLLPRDCEDDEHHHWPEEETPSPSSPLNHPRDLEDTRARIRGRSRFSLLFFWGRDSARNPSGLHDEATEAMMEV